tara:strand:- start:1683 stop:2747 length:1065 start_codon:yes stop_codon:yes gene_type:complete
MEELRFNQKLDVIPAFKADAVLNGTVFEVVSESRGTRSLRASLFRLAALIAEEREFNRAVLILVSPEVSRQRLKDEWRLASVTLRPEVFESLVLVVAEGYSIEVFAGHLTEREHDAAGIVASESGRRKRPGGVRKGPAVFEILRVLLTRWSRREGPITSKELAAICDCTYPTVAASLRELDRHIVRHSDRSVELEKFPKDAWFKLVASAEKIRSTHLYADRSGIPRSPEALMKRLERLNRYEVAVGGVVGARHYYPGLDLVGTPRVDLTVKREGALPATSELIRKIDPALKPAKPGETVALAVHYLHRKESFFVRTQKDWQAADEIECLLDLHESRLEAQALEFQQYLSRREIK